MGSSAGHKKQCPYSATLATSGFTGATFLP